jgi:hypothetical protein
MQKVVCEAVDAVLLQRKVLDTLLPVDLMEALPLCVVKTQRHVAP